MGGAPHTLLPQHAHEELQANQSEDTQTEQGEDHDVRQLLHGLNQRTHNGLQACRKTESSRTHRTKLNSHQQNCLTRTWQELLVNSSLIRVK